MYVIKQGHNVQALWSLLPIPIGDAASHTLHEVDTEF